ncbi:U-box domain-containing protein 17 [Zostera marina]|uniref:RING-type E3 ubiquitin transferase n=1 Tax=Zostera marina TaxID=29655 RepID=A0A0K9PF67_ZOSMR|nr:U-box domain-containing protein 17 [Zostera marina]
MAAVAPGPMGIFNHRRNKSPLTGSFFAPVDLENMSLLDAIASISSELITIASPAIPFQRRNIRSLILKVRSFLLIFESLRANYGPDISLPSTSTLCFKELYISLYRAKFLLEYCSQSSRLWLLLMNCQVSGYFRDLTLELCTLLDVFPSYYGNHGQDLPLSLHLFQQIDLLRSQTKRSTLYIDPNDENLRLKIYEFLDDFENGNSPSEEQLRTVYVRRLGIHNARVCKAEMEFLEEQIYNQEDELNPTVLDGVVALTRYARFLLFGFGPDVDFRKFGSFAKTNSMKGKVLQDIGDGDSETYVTIPKDFLCPISLDLMTDPVVVSTGQTYDRDSIRRWMDEGHNTCPNSGQVFASKRLVPNRALRNLIYQWCAVNYVVYDSPETLDNSDVVVVFSACKPALEANRFTTRLLVQLLSKGSNEAKTTAARELRLLARTAKENRAYIAEAGAIPFLRDLLWMESPVAQENAVTALLNLSIHNKNKSKIMDEEDCLKAIVYVLINGLTTESKENAAATLFSLSAVHNYKKRITDEDGAVEELATLLMDGTTRGKKDAVTALFNLSTHNDSVVKMVESGAATALVASLEIETVAEEAAGALSLLMRHKIVAETVAAGNDAIPGLVGLMRRGTPKAKENAVAALFEMCHSGGAKVTEKVSLTPPIAGLIKNLLFSGTKRARRKAASLARCFTKHEMSGALQYAGWDVQFPLRSRSVRRSIYLPEAANSESSSADGPVSVAPTPMSTFC